MSIQVRASSFGGCIKAQVAACLGYEPMAPPDRMQTIFDRGNVHEDLNAEALIGMGAVIKDEQMEVRVDRLPIGSIVGHIDGLVSRYIGAGPHDAWRLWESKSPNAWTKFEKAYKTGDYSDPLTQRYAWQISVYMHALELEAYVTCLEPVPCPTCKGTGIWYDGEGSDLTNIYEVPCPRCDGGNLPSEGRVKGFVIETPPYTMQDITDRLISINEWVKIGQLPQLCSVADYPCPFVALHEPEDRELVLDPAVVAASQRYVELGRIEAEAKKEKKELRPTLDAYYTRVGKYEAGKSEVTLYEHTESKLDEDAMRADGIDPDKYRREKKSMRLRAQ